MGSAMLALRTHSKEKTPAIFLKTQGLEVIPSSKNTLEVSLK